MNIKEVIKQFKRLENVEHGKPDNYKYTNKFNAITALDKLDKILSHHDGPNNGHHDNNSVIDYFPNALLVEDTIGTSPIIKEPVKEKKVAKKEDMWDFLDRITSNTENKKHSIDMNKTSKFDNSNDSNDSNESNNLTDLINQTNQTNLNESTDSDESNDVSTDIDAKTVCISCGESGSLIEDHRTSALICTMCGAVNEELLDQGPEWRQYNNDDARGDGINRCGCGTNPFFPKSSQGTFLVGNTNNRLKSKQRWGCVVYKEKSLNDVCEEIAQVCSKNGLTKIITDDAKILYKKFSDCKHQTGNSTGKQIIIRGVNRKSIIAGCVFKSCEKNKKPKSIKDIAKLFKLNEKKLTKGIKQLDNVLKRADDKTNFYDQFQDNDIIVDLICDRCPKINIHGDDIDLAVRIATNCCRMKLASDHNPESIAAGSVLLVVSYCKLNIDKKKIASTFETTDVTIGKIFAKISGFVDVLISDDYTNHIIKKFKING